MDTLDRTADVTTDRRADVTTQHRAAPRPARRPGLRRGRSVIVAVLTVVALGAVLRFTLLRPPLVSVAEVRHGDVAAEIFGTGTSRRFM